MPEHILVLTTVADDAEATRIANHLVERELVACVNIVGPIRSIYRWQGAVQEDGERLLVMKTMSDRFERVRVAIRELHSYDVPEVIAVPVAAGDDAYLAWITASCGGL